MNIKQAIDRIAFLKERIFRIDEAIKRAEIVTLQVSASVSVSGYDNHVTLSREQSIQLLKDTADGHQKEIDRIQPVIDMANAALKGVLS